MSNGLTICNFQILEGYMDNFVVALFSKVFRSVRGINFLFSAVGVVSSFVSLCFKFSLDLVEGFLIRCDVIGSRFSWNNHSGTILLIDKSSHLVQGFESWTWSILV